MKSYQIGTLALSALALIVVFQNCGGSGGLKSATPASDSAKTQTDEINSRYTLIGQIAAHDMSCSDDSECTAVALGHRACGGPEKYIVVSEKNPDLEQIEALAVELEQKERELQGVSASVGICEYKMPPETACVSNICQ